MMKTLAGSIILGMLLCGVIPAEALDPSLPPGGNFDLSHWYLGLPVDSSGGTSGKSASVPSALLVAGYTNALWFYTGADGAMTFWAPVTGATTGGSSYPRSELREQLYPPSNSTNWFAYGTHILNGQCKVIQVPGSKKVIIGQIHGYTGAALPLVKLQYNNGKIEALVKTNSTDDASDYKFTYAGVGLNDFITYQIKVVNGLISIAVNGLTNSMNVFQTDPRWATNTMYFKAGDYCQDNSGPTNEGARVAFYAVDLYHAPSITNQPASCSVLAGTSANFTVGVQGNPPFAYQWQFNGTNLAGATQGTLPLTNIQSTNAGNYTVIVTDITGVVTSSVAILTVNSLTPSEPSITTQPTNQTVTVGQDAPFSVTAGDTTPLSYQWYFNTNTALVDATNDWLTITAAQTTNAGSYTVIVTNSAGSVTSSVATLTVLTAIPPGTTATNVIVDDSFADGNRANTGPLQADWWSSSSTSGNSIECYPNQLGLISGTSGRGIHGTFAPQALAVGDTMSVTYAFTTPATVGNNLGTAFKVALMDFNDPGLAADLSSSSGSVNPLYTNLPGYMSSFDVNTGTTAGTSIYKHQVPNTSGRFLGTTGEWIDSSSSPDAGYAFAPNTEYVGVFSVTKTGTDSVVIFSSMSQGGVLMDSWSASDTGDTANHFGMVGFWANSSAFGSTTTAGEFQDNGITFSDIKVDVITASTAPPVLTIAVAGTNAILSWPSSTDPGYGLQSTPSLSSSAWSSAGTAVILGSEHVVTNALTPDAQFYRLEK